MQKTIARKVILFIIGDEVIISQSLINGDEIYVKLLLKYRENTYSLLL